MKKILWVGFSFLLSIGSLGITGCHHVVFSGGYYVPPQEYYYYEYRERRNSPRHYRYPR